MPTVQKLAPVKPTVDAKQKTKPKQKKPEPVVEAVPEPVVEAPVVVPEPVSSDSEVPTDSIEKQLEDLRETISSAIKELNDKLKTFRSVDASIKKLGSSIKKELKSKKKRKTKRADGVSSEHGFNAPVKISDELAEFFDLEKGSKLRRPEVTSLISKYADKYGLKESTNKSIFNPDAKLQKLLGPAVYPLTKGSEVNGYGIFNLQIYLKKHFVKDTAVTVI
jgi:chromatin remodeling complex protein RSC6